MSRFVNNNIAHIAKNAQPDSIHYIRILYKTRLPFILVFNKTDAQPHDFAIEWMQDFEAFQKALATHGRDQNGEPTYMNSLMSSMCLVLDEFYSHLRVSIFSSFLHMSLRHG